MSVHRGGFFTIVSRLLTRIAAKMAAQTVTTAPETQCYAGPRRSETQGINLHRSVFFVSAGTVSSTRVAMARPGRE